MLQYFALALMASTLSLHTINPKWITAGMEAETRYYLDNSRGRFTNRAMTDNDKLNAYLKVNTQFTAFEVLDFSMGAQGWSVKSGFNGGQMGGLWGISIHISDELELGWSHFSCHVLNLPDNCGSEDSIIIRFNYNFDNRKKSSVLGKLIK